MKNLLLLLALSALVSGCMVTDTNLYGNSANLYGGMGQSVNGDANNVSIFNIWNAEDALPLANQHCAKYGKKVVSYSFKGITGYYECGGTVTNDFDRVFGLVTVKTNLKEVGDCIRGSVVQLDDLKSDALTIAAGVGQVCSDKFDKFYTSIIENHKDSQSFTEDFKKELKQGFRQGRNEKILPYVLGWRSAVSSGWDKRKAPTEKELPDKLFEIGI